MCPAPASRRRCDAAATPIFGHLTKFDQIFGHSPYNFLELRDTVVTVVCCMEATRANSSLHCNNPFVFLGGLRMGDQRGNVPYGARGSWHRFDITHTGTGRYCTYRFCAFGGTASRGQLPIRIIAHARHREGWRLVRAPCTGVFFFFFSDNSVCNA